jgi:hypothetical protein
MIKSLASRQFDGVLDPRQFELESIKFRRNLAQKGLIATEEQLGTEQYQLQSDS